MYSTDKHAVTNLFSGKINLGWVVVVLWKRGPRALMLCCEAFPAFGYKGRDNPESWPKQVNGNQRYGNYVIKIPGNDTSMPQMFPDLKGFVFKEQ